MRLSAWACAAWLCVWLGCASGDAELAGTRCVSDAPCGALVCAAALQPAPADLAQLPLACGAPSARAAGPGEPCDAADGCDHGVCLLAGACALPCESAQDCGEGQACSRVYARLPTSGYAWLNACVDDVNLPRGANVVRELLSGAAHGGVDSLTLPPLAARTLYVLEHLDQTGWPVPPRTSTCRPPLCARSLHTDDRVLFDVDALSASSDGPINPIALGKHVDPLTVWTPNGPRLSAQPRSYELQVESTQPGDLRVTSLAREDTGARLDLNLYYVGARDLAPEGTRGPAPIAAALDEVERIFEPAGITIGELRQTRISGALLTRGAELPDAAASAGFDVLRSQYQVLPQLPELLKLSAGAANVALDVFFVADIDAQGGADVGGIAGGTPIAFGMHGTAGSGVAIATDMFLSADDPARLGRTLAHELGHALGLFHTSEVDGLVIDPLDDTPACTLAQDRDHSGSLDAAECAAHGGDNLMFCTSDAGTQISEQQAAVLRAALILQ